MRLGCLNLEVRVLVEDVSRGSLQYIHVLQTQAWASVSVRRVRLVDAVVERASGIIAVALDLLRCVIEVLVSR